MHVHQEVSGLKFSIANNQHVTGVASAHYGKGTGLIQMTANCSGSESDITECSLATSTSAHHENDVGVNCRKGEMLKYPPTKIPCYTVEPPNKGYIIIYYGPNDFVPCGEVIPILEVNNGVLNKCTL